MTENGQHPNGKRYTVAERDEVLRVYVEHGPREAARLTGVSARTITKWAKEDGVSTEVTARMTQAHEAAQAQIEGDKIELEASKIELARLLLGDALRMRATLWEPCTERVVKVVGTGKGESETEIVDVDLTEPSFADKQRILNAVGTAVDKVQILTGAPTERIETFTGHREEAEVRLAKLVHLRVA